MLLHLWSYVAVELVEQLLHIAVCSVHASEVIDFLRQIYCDKKYFAKATAKNTHRMQLKEYCE